MNPTIHIKVHNVRDELSPWYETPLHWACMCGKWCANGEVDNSTNDLVVATLQRQGASVARFADDGQFIRLLPLRDEDHQGEIESNRHHETAH